MPAENWPHSQEVTASEYPHWPPQAHSLAGHRPSPRAKRGQSTDQRQGQARGRAGAECAEGTHAQAGPVPLPLAQGGRGQPLPRSAEFNGYSGYQVTGTRAQMQSPEVGFNGGSSPATPELDRKS